MLMTFPELRSPIGMGIIVGGMGIIMGWGIFFVCLFFLSEFVTLM